MDKKDDTGLSQNLCCFFILFHPDYHCRLWIHTKSADFEKKHGKNHPHFCLKRSWAYVNTLTTGRDFHPALRMLA